MYSTEIKKQNFQTEKRQRDKDGTMHGTVYKPANSTETT